MRKIYLFLVLFFLATSATVLAQGSAARYYVTKDGNDANAGTSWEEAFKTPQKALSAAVSGDSIWVAAGTYYPDAGPSITTGNRAAYFQMKAGVAIYGGFAGTESDLAQRNWNTNVTILSGDVGTTGNNSDNSYRVVFSTGLTNTAVLDGFTITGGNASASGGGMLNVQSSPTIANCTFSGNTAFNYGAGMFNQTISSPAVSNCTFSGNTAGSGGGMYNTGASSPALTNCRFLNNATTYEGTGGGMYNGIGSSPTLVTCSFSGNAAFSGAGMYNISASVPTLTNCNFTSNVAGNLGGGIYNGSSSPVLVNGSFSGNTAFNGGGMYNDQSSPACTKCSFTANKAATSNGGGMYNGNASSPVILNSSFTQNTAVQGGGIYNVNASAPTCTNCLFLGNTASIGAGMVNNQSSPQLTNCSFSGNTADDGGGGGMFNASFSGQLTNCIFWGDSGGELSNANNSTTTISNSIVQGGCPMDGTSCTNVLDLDPLFVSATDLHLQACSPAIDSGSDATNLSTTDLDGNARKVDAITGGSVIDMGAYEYQQVLPTFYQNNDGDGYGNAAVTIQACSAPPNYVTDNTDCDDTKASIHPGAVEICNNSIDDNCDGRVDEGCSVPPAITVTVYPSAIVEGNSGKKYMYFLLLLNHPAPTDCEVEFETHNITAKSGSDYQSKTTHVHFVKGQLFKLVGVYTYGDKKVEANETFQVELEEPEHVVIGGTGTATGTIINDDGQRSKAQAATPDVEKQFQEGPNDLVVPNLLHRAELWRIPNLPGRNQVMVVDMNGRTVLKIIAYANDRAFNNAAAGLYFYQIITTDKNGTSKTYRGKLLIVE